MKEKESKQQQSEKIIHELSIKLEEIEGKRKEFAVRDQTDLLHQKENNEILRAEIDELENKLADEKKNEIEIEYKLKAEISNLKLLIHRADEKFRVVERDYEIFNSRYKEQQAILSSERCRFEEELKELRLRLDEKSSKSVNNRWSISATCQREYIYKTGDDGFMDLDMLRRGPSSLQERYTTAGSKSDTEKENISLKSELTVALENIEKIKQEHNGLSERNEGVMKATKRTIDNLQREKNCLEQEKVNWKTKLNQIQSDLNLYKQEQVNQQDSSRGRIDNLLQQNKKLENDKGVLRDRIYSLEKENVKFQELKERSVKLDTDLTLLQNLKTENDDLKTSLVEVNRELYTLKKRYNKETVDRMSSDNISTKLKDENDRLRRERNSARIELQRVLREKKEYYQNINTEQVLAREELQSKEREKSELVALFKDKEDRDLQTIKLYEKEIETLKSKCRDDNDKMRQSEYEIETLKSRRKDDNDKLQRLEHEIDTLKSRNRDDNDKMRQMERETEILKSRLSEEESDQTLEQIGKGSIIRAQTMVHYDKLFAEKSEEVSNKVSELYENTWKEAMIELGDNGGKKKNIEFLLKILENAYSFCERMEGTFTEEFEQAMLNAAANIKEVVDTAVFVRPILERLEHCINQLFWRECSEYQEHRTREPVHSYITEALSLSWFMVTRNPRVFISTTIPKECHPQFYDTYSTDGSEVDYVVLPIVKWSTNENEIICKGIAAFK